MKSKVFTTFLVLIAIAVSILSFLSIDTSPDINNGQRHSTNDYILNLKYKKDFRILQLGDIHLGSKDNIDEHLSFLTLTINDANADLIVLNGDTFTFASKRVVKQLFDFIDSFEIPWTVTFGNHDEQNSFSIDWLTDFLNNYGSSCMFVDVKNDDVFGYSNFAINLIDNDKIHDQIIFMDSNRYYFGDYIGYDYVKPSQIEWYERLVADTEKQNGSLVKSLLFMHIPLPEFDDAWENAGAEDAINEIKAHGGSREDNSATGLESNVSYSEFTKQYGIDGAIFEYGFSNSDSYGPEYNSGLFDTIVKYGSTKAILASHDHRFNSRILYKGIQLIYGVNSTDRVLRNNNMMGGHVIIIHDDHSLSYEHIYHKYEELYNE